MLSTSITIKIGIKLVKKKKIILVQFKCKQIILSILNELSKTVT